VGHGLTADYQSKDEAKLWSLAKNLGLKAYESLEDEALAAVVAEKGLKEF
jgi:hypothetical protein